MATSTLGSGTLVLAGTTSGTTTVTATAVAGTTTLTLPAATDTLVGKATTDTLTNKTLTGAVMNGTVGATTPSTGAFTTLSATGVTTVQAGTASLPAITTTGDTNTGIWFPAADTIAFTEGGAESMRIDASGNLGLGVTPDAWGGTNNSKGLQVGRSGAVSYSSDDARVALSANAFGSVTNGWKFINNGGAAYYSMSDFDNNHRWFVATTTSGTADDPIIFTQAMTLDASGNLLVGTTNSSGTVGAGFKVLGGRPVTVNAASTDGTTVYELYSTGAAAYRFYVGMGGTIFATSIVITAISDQRLKENIRDIDTGLSSIMALKPRRFDWKEGKGQDKKNAAGFIAQEFETVFPECVSTSKSGEDGIEYKNINHETLIPTLVKAIQELKAEFDAYKASHP